MYQHSEFANRRQFLGFICMLLLQKANLKSVSFVTLKFEFLVTEIVLSYIMDMDKDLKLLNQS